MLRRALAWTAAVALASLLPALAFALLAFDARIRPGHPTATAFALALATGLALVLLLGVPITAWLRARQRFTAARMLLAGFLAGLGACLGLLLAQTAGDPAAMAGLLSPAVGVIALSAGGFGMVAAFGLWVVLRVGLPPARG